MNMAAGDVPVSLNPDLDVSGLAEQFAETGRMQITNVLHPDTANRLHQCLAQETPWMLAYLNGEQPSYLTREQMGSMPPEQQAGFMQQIFQSAANEFAYVYLDFPVSGTANVEGQQKFYSHSVLDFLQSEDFLPLFRELTKLDGPFKVDTHATCFQSGHFLTNHNDLVTADDPRECAFVLNATPDWNVDWGAQTAFYDDQGNVVESFVPIFNSLTIFRVPQQHAVTFVPPFCQKQRLAMSGWFFRPEGVARSPQ